MASPLVIAHRGASAEKPENTLAAFRRALAIGVDAIELDVHVTRDGVPVVFHDDKLRRLTGTAGRIADRTWPQLSRLRVRGTEPIPRLSHVLQLVGARAVIQIELKAGVPVAPVARALVTARASRQVVLASFAPGLVRAAARLAPSLPRMLISHGNRPDRIVAELAALGASGVSVDHRSIPGARWVEYFQARGFVVWAWTVNEARAMRRLAGWGVDGILTDNPALLRNVV